MSDTLGEFDFDDDGIYREKRNSLSLDTGMLVDENGIWKDDADSLYTFHTDSGIGIRKSSDLSRFRGEVDLHDDARDRESCTTDAKSINISEFEASESAAEDVSFEGRSLDDHIAFPELQDESYDDFLGDGDPLGYMWKASDVRDLPEVAGDSIFTQREDRQIGHQGQSLLEFEHLEAQIEKDPGDGGDLIGAYLKDLKEDEDELKYEPYDTSEPAQDSINFGSFEFDDSVAESPLKSAPLSRKFSKQAGSPLKAFPQPTNSESPRLSATERSRCLPATPLISSRSKSQLQLNKTGELSPPPRPSSAGVPYDYKHLYSPQTSGDFTDLSAVNLAELRMSIQESDLSNAEKAHELKALFLQEVQQRRLNDETYKQLQIEYNSLLKKYAEAENTIDELRLGAKVMLFSDSPVPQPAPSVSDQPQSKLDNASLSSIALGKKSVSAASTTQVSRSPSCVSMTSGSVFAPNADQPSDPTESASLMEDTAKLAIMAKSTGVEDQINALQILLSEKHLSLEDQEKALSNIKKTFEDLRHHHREAKDEHEFLRRQGMTPGGASESSVICGFDENKDLEGAIYKLSMKLDDVDHRVQENLKERTKRKPYQGGPQPLRGDHSINVTPQGDHKRPSSVDGITPEIDRKVQRLLKEYDHLARRYQGLKQMTRTPERDDEISRLIEDLKEIYQQAPDNSKPAVPQELRHKVIGRRRSHASPLSDRLSPPGRRSRSSEGSPRSSQESRVVRESPHDHSYHSDASLNGRGSNASLRSREERSSDYTSGMSRPASDLRPRGRRELPETHPPDRKAPQKPLRQSFPTRSAGQGHRRLPKVTGPRHHDIKEVWKNSGKPAIQRSSKTTSHGSDRGYIRTDARSPVNGDYSHSDSDSSADSVVERSRRQSSSLRGFSGDSSFESVDDRRGGHGTAVYGSQSESDSDEALSLAEEDSLRRRDYLHANRVPMVPQNRAVKAATAHHQPHDHHSHNNPRRSRSGRSLSPPRYDRMYKQAKQQQLSQPAARNRRLDFADGYERERSSEAQFITQPHQDLQPSLNASKMRRYPSMPNLNSEQPAYYAVPTGPNNDAQYVDSSPYSAVQYANPEMAEMPFKSNGYAPVETPIVGYEDHNVGPPANGMYYAPGQAQYDLRQSQYGSGPMQYGLNQANDLAQPLSSEPANYTSSRARHRSGHYSTGPTMHTSGQTAYGSGQEPYGSNQAQYVPGPAQYSSAPAQYLSGPTPYYSGPALYSTGQAQYISEPAQDVSGQAQYSSGQALHSLGQAQYASGPATYVPRQAGSGLRSPSADHKRFLHSPSSGLKPGRVRYYVREYRPPNSLLDESEHPDLSMTIQAALKTAKHLQVVSQRMKSKLKSQMTRSFSENNLLF